MILTSINDLGSYRFTSQLWESRRTARSSAAANSGDALGLATSAAAACALVSLTGSTRFGAGGGVATRATCDRAAGDGAGEAALLFGIGAGGRNGSSVN